MTRYRRWPNYRAWRLLRRESPRVRKAMLPYFEQPKIKLRVSYLDEAERTKGQIQEEAMLSAMRALRPHVVQELSGELLVWRKP